MFARELDPGTLKNIPLFSVFTDVELTRLIHASQRRNYPKCARIASAGSKSDGLYVLLSGRAKVLIEDGEGREVILAFVGSNEFFGESSLLDEERRSTTVQSTEACDVLFVPKKAFLECFTNNFEAALLLLRNVVERLRRADRKIEDLALLDVYERVTRVLIDTSREENGHWVVEPGSEQIAQMVAASREMVSRVLKDLCEQGFVSRRKRKIIVLDRASVASRAGARSSRRSPRSLGRKPVRLPGSA